MIRAMLWWKHIKISEVVNTLHKHKVNTQRKWKNSNQTLLLHYCFITCMHITIVYMFIQSTNNAWVVFSLHSFKKTQNGSEFQLLQMTRRQRVNFSQSCQDVGVNDACRYVKPIEVVSRFILVEVNVEPVKVDKHGNCWVDHSSFLKKQWSPLFARSGEETGS